MPVGRAAASSWLKSAILNIAAPPSVSGCVGDCQSGRRVVQRINAGTVRGMTIAVERCIVTRDLTEPRLSPDGRCVVYAMAASGSGALMIQVLDGSPVRQLTAHPPPRTARGFGGGCWCWSADGSAVVYVGVDGELWMQPVPTGSVRRLTRHGPDVGAAAPAATADGMRIVYTIDDSEVWSTRLDDGSTERLDDGSADFVFDPCASPDGASVAWQAWNVPDMPWDASRVQRATFGRPGVEEHRPGAAVQQVRFMPDGTQVCLRDDHGWLNLWLGDSPLLDEPYEHGGPAWGMGQRSFAVSPDGTQITFTRNEAGFCRLCVVDVADRSVREIAEAVHGQLSWEGGRIAALRSGACTPTQVLVYDAATGERDIVAIGPLSGWENVGLVEPDLVEVIASDGDTLHARVYRSDTPTDRLLCWLHGGPTDQWQVAFMPRIAVLARVGLERAGAGSSRLDRTRPRLPTSVARPVGRARRRRHDRCHQPRPQQWLGIAVAHRDRGVVGRWVHRPRCRRRKPGDRRGGDRRLSRDRPLGSCGTQPPVRAALHRLTRRATARLGSAAPRAITDQLRRSTRRDATARDARRQRSGRPRRSESLVCRALSRLGGEVELVVYEGEGHGFRKPENQLDEYRRMQAFLARYVPGG